jgi:hypothetical protein
MYKRVKEFSSNPYHQFLQTASSNMNPTSNMNPSFVAVYLSNPGDFIIRVEIASANIDMFLSAASIEKINMNIGQTYNIKLTQGRIIKNTKCV